MLLKENDQYEQRIDVLQNEIKSLRQSMKTNPIQLPIQLIITRN